MGSVADAACALQRAEPCSPLKTPRPPPQVADKMGGSSGAELKAVCTEAGMFALRERRVHVTQVRHGAGKRRRQAAGPCPWTGAALQSPCCLPVHPYGHAFVCMESLQPPAFLCAHIPSPQEDFEMAVAKVKKAGDDKNMSLKKVRGPPYWRQVRRVARRAGCGRPSVSRLLQCCGCKLMSLACRLCPLPFNMVCFLGACAPRLWNTPIPAPRQHAMCSLSPLTPVRSSGSDRPTPHAGCPGYFAAAAACAAPLCNCRRMLLSRASCWVPGRGTVG